jgi:hypothetical protein
MCKGCRTYIWRKVVVWDDAVMASTGLPPGLQAGGPRARGLVCPVPGGCVLAGQLLGLKGRRGVKTPWRLARRNRFRCGSGALGGAKCTQRAAVTPCGSYVPLYNRFHRGEWITRVSGGEGALDTPGPLNGTSEGKIPKADDRPVAPSLWFCRWFCGVVARLQPECQYLVHLADLLGEVMQGPLQDGIGAVVERLEGWDMCVPLGEDCEYVGQGFQQQSAGPPGGGVLCLVSRYNEW